MTNYAVYSESQDYAWFIAVPKRQEFTEPKFHFGERVKYSGEDNNGAWYCQTGRIVGMQFSPSQGWQYQLLLDSEEPASTPRLAERYFAELELTLVKDSASLRTQFKGESEWLSTQQAASRLGISAEQLRRLRRKGFLKVGHHCRDTSVPGSNLSRWQWHVDRCSKALDIPPEKRPVSKI